LTEIYDCLALILHLSDDDRWLGIDDRGGDPRPPLDLLHPMDAKLMKMTPDNPAVGNWRNNGPEIIPLTSASPRYGRFEFHSQMDQTPARSAKA
jgi:putative SOS response-associated peptidase YedK